MQPSFNHPRRRVLRLECVIGAIVLLANAWAGQPKIELIELFLSNQVLIHFDTEANRTYELQYTETLTNGVPGGNWTNLFVAPNIPFINHYIIVDTRTRPQRFYRLRVFP
jgi:hypothetical protein